MKAYRRKKIQSYSTSRMSAEYELRKTSHRSSLSAAFIIKSKKKLRRIATFGTITGTQVFPNNFGIRMNM